MKQFKLTFLVVALMMILSNVGWGQTVVSYTGMGSITCPASPTATISPTVTGLTFSQMSRGSGVTCASASTGISGSGFNVTLANALTGSKWYTYSITSDATVSFTISSFSIISQVSSATGSPNVSVYYDIGGGAKTLIGSFTPTASSVTYPIIPGTPISVGASQTINIYIVPNNLTASGTTCRVNNSSSVTVTTSPVVVSGTSTVTAGSGSEPATLSSLINAQGDAVLNFDFTVLDDGGTPATDGVATQISQIVINQVAGNDIADWTQAIQGALLTDGTNTQTANVTINATNITIASIANVSGELGYIADNGSKTYQLMIWLKNPLGGTLPTTIDGLNLVFGVNNSSFTFNGGSTLAASQDVNSGAANNAVSVVSSKLKFVMQPTNTNLSVTMSPAVTIEATDTNNNRDLDKTGSVTLVSSGTMTGVPSATLTSGFGTFSDIVHTVVGTGLSLTASLSGLTDATSNTFNISIVTPGLLLFEENFDYTSGQLLTANGWTAHSAGGTSPILVNSSGLIYSNYGSTGIGNSAIINASGEDVNRTFTQQNSGSTTYCAFLVNVTSATTGGDYILHLGPTTIGSEFRGRFFTKSVSGNLQFGISTSTTSSVNYSATNYVFGTTYLIVIKHYFDGTSQTSSLFINPSLTTEPTPDQSETSTLLIPTNIGSVAIRQSSTSNVAVIDGIRIGTGWGAVLGNPSYSSADNINAGNYNNLSVLSGDLTLTGNVNVNGILTLTSGNIISTATNKLTLGEGATISGGSATSFVSGPLAKICNSTSEFTFHVGKGSSYLPLGIMPTTTANVTTYEAEYFNTPYSNTTSFGTSGLAGVSLNGYHELSRPSGTVPAVLRIYWDANSGVITTSDLRVAHWNSSLTEWENLGFNSISGGPSGGSLLTNSSVSSFSPFALGSVTNQPLPVNLSSLNSSIIGRNIKLNWTTASETNNSGFNVERMNVADNNWSKITFVSGHGTVNTPTNYSFEDRNLQTGKYKYRLKQIDVNGNFEYFNLNGEVEIGVPKTFNLSQNYPNPFNPVTKINFDLPTDGKVTMMVYDITGREITRLLNSEYKKAGYYTTDFNAGMLSSGVYFYSLSADNFRMTKKMVLLK